MVKYLTNFRENSQMHSLKILKTLKTVTIELVNINKMYVNRNFRKKRSTGVVFLRNLQKGSRKMVSHHLHFYEHSE